jgi:hypothetical protein
MLTSSTPISTLLSSSSALRLSSQECRVTLLVASPFTKMLSKIGPPLVVLPVCLLRRARWHADDKAEMERLHALAARADEGCLLRVFRHVRARLHPSLLVLDEPTSRLNSTVHRHRRLNPQNPNSIGGHRHHSINHPPRLRRHRHRPSSNSSQH